MINESIETFLKTANTDLIGAVKSVCRKRYAETVRVLDSLSELEVEAIKNGGLLALPQPKISELRRAMRADNFKWA